MARWRLMSAHYLNVPGTEWEQRETDPMTGRQARKVYKVPRFLNPEDKSDHTTPGEIVVCYEGKGQRSDIVFEGEPTAEMEPLDDEATAITEELRPNWKHPIENDMLFSDALRAGFEKQIAQLLAGGGPVSAKPAIDAGAFSELQAQVAALMAQNAELMAQMKSTKRI